MKAYLIQIDAWSGATATPVRLASHNDERLCHLDGETWWPAIAALPTLRYDFFDGAFDAGSITSPSGDMSVSFNAIPSLPALSLHDTRLRIWRGELGDAWGDFSLMFDGRVQEQPATTEGIASIKFGVDDSWLDQPLLATYGGTGGADGPPDIQGEVKPLALGAPRFAPGVLVDAVENIYELSGYGAINAVEMAFERLNRFGAPTGNAANFAALKAADIAPGAWATCLSGGYVRFGAPPDGLLSFHVQGDAVGGWSRKPGDLIARIATIGGGAGKFSASDMTALNAARPWNLSVMVTAQTTARELIQRIAASVNAVAFVDWLGQLRVAPIGIGTASLTLASDGSALPPVASVEQVAVAAPYWKIAQGAAVTWQVHGLNDIAFNAPLNPRGPYSAAESYREGDMVTLADGSQWLFVGTAPATGSAPSDVNPNWFRLADNITAGNITYEDGTPVEDLKPAEPGATNGATPEQADLLNQLDADTAQALIDIAAAQATITSMQTDADAMQAALTTAQGNIATQGAQITAQGASILANSNDIATINSTLTSQGASITLLQTTASDHTGQIAILQSTASTQGASITANATAITSLQGTVADYQLRLSSNRSNLLPNSSGSAGLRGWSGSADWSVTSSNSGSYFILGGATTGTFVLVSDPIALPAGTYTISYETNLTGSPSSAYCDVFCYDADGTELLDSGQNAQTSATSWGDRAARAFTFTAPAGTATMRVRQVATKTTAADRARFRRIQLETGSVWSEYSEEASIALGFTAISTAEGSLATLSSTVSTQGASITSLQSASTTQAGQITTLTTNLATTNSNVSANATAISTANTNIASLTTRVSTAESSITTNASAITTLQGSVATLTTRISAGGVNLLPNGGLEDGFNSGIANAGNFSLVNSTRWGRYAQVTGIGVQAFEFSPVAVAPNATYTLSCDPILFGGASTGYADVVGYNSSGAPVYDGPQNSLTGPFDFDTTTGRRGQIAITFTTPSDVVSVRCRFVCAVVSSNVCGFRQMKLEIGSQWTPYTPEASVAQSFQALSTLNSQYASLSSTVSTQGVTITSQQTAITTINGNVTTLFGQYVLNIDVNGRVAGMKLANNGSATSLKFRSDLVTFETSSGSGQRTEYSGGNWRVYDSSGTLRTRMGVW